MPIPAEYQRATEDFHAFLADARDEAGLSTTHQAFTMVQGVLQTFRRRLDLCEAITFAGALPPGLRALFVVDWDPREPKHPFVDRATMTAEAQLLRAEHNFAPASAIRNVATALRRHVDPAGFDRVLAGLPVAAIEFWHTMPVEQNAEY